MFDFGRRNILARELHDSRDLVDGTKLGLGPILYNHLKDQGT
jgi:hypothetical protein